MSSLTSDECEAIRLIVHDGKSYHHAAEALGVTVTTINNWKHRGLSKLRKYAEQVTTQDNLAALETSVAGYLSRLFLSSPHPLSLSSMAPGETPNNND